jgi:hypothetical protein
MAMDLPREPQSHSSEVNSTLLSNCFFAFADFHCRNGLRSLIYFRLIVPAVPQSLDCRMETAVPCAKPK